jgi:two-component system, LuxR family, sensor kinase FixL
MKISRYLRDAAVFAPCYVLLDWVSYIHPLGAFNITPWNPQPALAIAWMLLGGLGHAPAVFLTIALADGVIRGFPAGFAVTGLTAFVLTAGYAGIAVLLRAVLRPQPGLHGLRQLTLFVAVVAGATVVVAAGFVGVLRGAGELEPGALPAAWLRFWVGDAVGVLVTAPLVLAAADAERRGSLNALARRAETYLQIGVVVATLWLIFAGLGGDPSHHFYLLFPPLIWIAVRGAMEGAIIAIAIVQIGVVFGIHHRALQTLPAIELQALVAALTLTALYLGVMVEERARAAENLKHSLRLATAGEMAGAIAHEVNQPLTALANYGRAAQMLIQAGRQRELGGVIASMQQEASRASEVVRRLRDLFRHGTTRLEPVPVAQLLETVPRRDDGGVTVKAEQDLPDVLVDRLQIELVLRNLVANAAEAVAGRASGHGEITVTVKRDDARHLRIVVADNGPGIPQADLGRVFEPFVSGKPSGMGLGLAVSRAIAEAHGGTLEARAASHGEFHLVLPCLSHG